MTKATVSSKGQIAIPKAVRERLKLKPGTELAIEVQGETLLMRRMASGFPDWRTMRGMAKGKGTKALEEERAEERARDDARIAGLKVRR
jgi:AbrB family looped-hinge helix DNA binding protein